MKYAIYDKAADGYLTKMECITDIPDTALGLQCEYNEYITEAKLLDTPKEAADAIVRIESFKFMEKGRFVIHSFDETLLDQYIISEAGNPTKVVDNITVDLNGSIDIKYGTMPLHWSTPSLMRAITRLDALQKAASDAYTTWRDTFDIYKVFTVIDERSCTHYQFINVTEKGLDSAKEEENALTKRIEELEKANYDLGEQVTARGAVANRLQEEKDKLEAKVESIKKETRNWKNLYENAACDRNHLIEAVDTIYNDLKSVTACDELKDTLVSLKPHSWLDAIPMFTKADCTLDGENYLTAKDEIYSIVDQMITILESLALNKSCAFSSAEEVKRAKSLANDIIDIWESDDKFEVTLKKFSQLYEAVNNPSDNDDIIMYAFKGVLEIFSSLEDHVRGIIDESVTWKNRAAKAEKALGNQKRLNKVNSDTIDRMVVEKRTTNRELSHAADALKEVNDKNEGLSNMLKEISCHVVDIMYATKERDYNIMIPKLIDISNEIGVKFSDDGPIYCISVILNAFIRIAKEGTDWKLRAEEAISAYTRCNGALGEWKRKYRTMQEERDKAFERAETFKRIANSVYGISIPARCNGKQAFCDVVNGKKILIDKKRYDDLVEYVANINLTYDTRFCMMDKPVYLSTITESLNDLTK